MKRRYILAPQAARDLVQIWRYIKKESSQETADRVESVIRSKFAYLADFPQGGHWRRDLTSRRSSVSRRLFVPDRLPPGNEAAANCRHSARAPRRAKDSAEADLRIAFRTPPRTRKTESLLNACNQRGAPKRAFGKKPLP